VSRLTNVCREPGLDFGPRRCARVWPSSDAPGVAPAELFEQNQLQRKLAQVIARPRNMYRTTAWRTFGATFPSMKLRTIFMQLAFRA